MTDIQFEVSQPGVALSRAASEQVRALFDAAYYSYHYTDEAISADRIRIMLKADGEAAGYGTIVRQGRFGYLSNLVVDPRHQGRGLGTMLERRRADECRALRLTPYVSCVTVGVQSQRGKISLGMRRLNLKYGYRVGVFSEADVSSAATYVGTLSSMRPLSGSGSRAVHNGQRRVRYTCILASDVERALDRIGGEQDYYVDLLCNSECSGAAARAKQLRLTGLDLDLERHEYGVLFQARNLRYERALKQGLELAEPEDYLTEQSVTQLLAQWNPEAAASS